MSEAAIKIEPKSSSDFVSTAYVSGEAVHTINISCREEYLEFRGVWKQEYKELSEEIRESKRVFKESQKNNLGVSGGTLAALKHVATEMLSELAAVKALAKSRRKQQ